MILLTLLAAAYTSAFQTITLDEFKTRPIPAFAQKLTGQDLVDYVNIVQSFFKTLRLLAAEAKKTPEARSEMDNIRRNYGANVSTLTKEERRTLIMDKRFLEEPEGAVYANELNIDDSAIPESFDARTQWPSCTSIRTIRDQSACGSCWAVSAASVMSDRLCIQSGGKNNKFVSDTDIFTCCGFFCGFGCHGGYPYHAWKFAMSTGACSGGAYNQKPYPFYPCGDHKDQPYYGPCPKEGYSTPKCQKKCHKDYNRSYDWDKIHVNNVYFVPKTAEAIQKEIMTHGPVQATFTVYEDFLSYKSGVYVHTAGGDEGGHAIKIIGWGVENGIPYWLVSNSWNLEFGENGLFRIARGKNECGIESQVVAGLMKV